MHSLLTRQKLSVSFDGLLALGFLGLEKLVQQVDQDVVVGGVQLNQVLLKNTHTCIHVHRITIKNLTINYITVYICVHA